MNALRPSYSPAMLTTRRSLPWCRCMSGRRVASGLPGSSVQDPPISSVRSQRRAAARSPRKPFERSVTPPRSTFCSPSCYRATKRGGPPSAPVHSGSNRARRSRLRAAGKATSPPAARTYASRSAGGNAACDVTMRSNFAWRATPPAFRTISTSSFRFTGRGGEGPLSLSPLGAVPP